MASPKSWKDYFDSPTLSDLTIRLSDRTVHAHRIVLCRGSEYFEKLLTGNFKESGASEVTLHEDDPQAAVELLRYIYGLDYDEFHKDSVGEMQFLAITHVTAAKYQITGLEDKTYDEMRKVVIKEELCCEEPDRTDDFLNAIQTVLSGTAQQDDRMRKLMIDCCFWNLPFLSNKVDKFSDLLMDNEGLSIEIMTRFTSTFSPYEGTWSCRGEWHPDAEPSCYECLEPFPMQFMLLYRSKQVWQCPACEHEGQPHCFDEFCSSRSSSVPVQWVWNADDPGDLRLRGNWGEHDWLHESSSWDQ